MRGFPGSPGMAGAPGPSGERGAPGERGETGKDVRFPHHSINKFRTNVK